MPRSGAIYGLTKFWVHLSKMDNKSSKRKISAHANWRIPRHSNLWDLDFDPHPSLRYAFGPVWGDPLVWALSALHIFAYGYFGYALATLSMEVCRGWLHALGFALTAALGIQVVWAMKAVVLLDKANSLPRDVVGTLWRIVRTAAISLPFSLVPSWVIGCVAWPVIRINIHGGSHFYDQSIVLGQYVQNSIWYIGAKNGSLRENYVDYLDLTILQRSRYWDCAAEQSYFNTAIAFFACVVLGGLMVYAGDSLVVSLLGLASLSGAHTLLFFAILIVGFIFSVINTTGLGAVSILEYLKNEKQIADESDLQPDQLSRWMVYVPHALAGSVIYLLFLYVFLSALLNQTDLCPPLGG